MPVDTQRLGREVNELLVLATLADGPEHGYRIALDVVEESDGAFELRTQRVPRRPHAQSPAVREG